MRPLTCGTGKRHLGAKVLRTHSGDPQQFHRKGLIWRGWTVARWVWGKELEHFMVRRRAWPSAGYEIR